MQARPRLAADGDLKAGDLEAAGEKLAEAEKQLAELTTADSLVYGVQESDARKALQEIETAEALPSEFASELGRLAYLIEATGEVGKSRAASAASCARNAEMLLGNHSGPITDARLKRMSEVKKLLIVGQELDPNNKKVGRMLAEIDDQIAAASLQMESDLRSQNIARVYDLSILAPEGAPDRASKKPPFEGYWVHLLMRPNEF